MTWGAPVSAPYTVESALPLAVPALSNALAEGFEGYAVSIPDDPVAFAQRLRGEQIDLASSLVAVVATRPVGLALIARRSDTARIAALGVSVSWRRHGVGAALMRASLAAAAARGETRVMLEVIEGNDRALQLYRSLGFEVQRRLVGYERPAGSGVAAPICEERVNLVARDVVAHMKEELPWPLAVPSMLVSGPQARAVRLGPASALISVSAQSIVLRALVVPWEQRGQGHATRLLRALAAEYPDHRWVVPPLIPESWGRRFFTRNGFHEQPLSQLEMMVSL
ncbi:hypothetical protein GCM10008949_38860 [Deinococcus humi]|nr:GNAT family N-acetyltransferase [Deinococcus humi]GGO35817.1 hypothetical protein GCM10008949_38860 [Deinococcus humi]